MYQQALTHQHCLGAMEPPSADGATAFVACVLALAKAIVGAGCLALPRGFFKLRAALGTAVLVLVTGLSSTRWRCWSTARGGTAGPRRTARWRRQPRLALGVADPRFCDWLLSRVCGR